MLKIQSLSGFHLQAIIHSLNLLCQRPLISFMTILVIAISLALPAFFWMFAHNLSQSTTAWAHGGHISLYLKPTTAAKSQALLKQLRATEGVGQATLKTSDEGLAELIKQEGMQDIMRYLPENPLPAVIDISPALMIDSSVHLNGLAERLKTFPEVEQVKLDLEWINRLDALLNLGKKIAHVLMFLLSIGVVLIIGTTLRLAIHNRQEEIQVLKLIGASDPFILRPFIYLSFWYGLAGAILAVLMVNILASSLTLVINQWLSAYQMHYPLSGLSIRQILLLIGFAIILGHLAAHLSVKGQLLKIEPYK